MTALQSNEQFLAIDGFQPAIMGGALGVVRGRVVPGVRLGRTIGFPTANMQVPEAGHPEPGIYVAEFTDEKGASHGGVASLGTRPTVVTNGEMLLETFVLDFEGNLYGQLCSVRLLKFLRPEVRFDGLDPMIEQIHRDVAEARRFFALGR